MIEPTAGAANASGATAPTKPDPVSRGFEQLLVQQLAKEMLKTAGDGAGAYGSLLPSALADAVQDAGGLGLDLDVEGPRS